MSMKQDEQLSVNQTFNPNIDNCTINMIGDHLTICQIIQLLAYIRHAVQNNMKTDINVSIGNNVANAQLLFDVNGIAIDDLITKNSIEIN